MNRRQKKTESTPASPNDGGLVHWGQWQLCAPVSHIEETMDETISKLRTQEYCLHI
jgi:hypothetical protein